MKDIKPRLEGRPPRAHWPRSCNRSLSNPRSSIDCADFFFHAARPSNGNWRTYDLAMKQPASEWTATSIQILKMTWCQHIAVCGKTHTFRRQVTSWQLPHDAEPSSLFPSQDQVQRNKNFVDGRQYDPCFLCYHYTLLVTNTLISWKKKKKASSHFYVGSRKRSNNIHLSFCQYVLDRARCEAWKHAYFCSGLFTQALISPCFSTILFSAYKNTEASK